MDGCGGDDYDCCDGLVLYLSLDLSSGFRLSYPILKRLKIVNITF